LEKLRKIVAKFLTFESQLGNHVFLNVPVLVESSTDPEKFDPENDDYSLSAAVIDNMSRKLAKKWLQGYLKIDSDGNHIRRYHLSAQEIYGIMLICGINAADLASILQMSKSQISKVLANKDNQKLSPTAVRFLLIILKEELSEAGYARKVLERKELNVRQSEDEFDLKIANC
jgi:hypothetical protein